MDTIMVVPLVYLQMKIIYWKTCIHKWYLDSFWICFSGMFVHIGQQHMPCLLPGEFFIWKDHSALWNLRLQSCLQSWLKYRVVKINVSCLLLLYVCLCLSIFLPHYYPCSSFLPSFPTPFILSITKPIPLIHPAYLFLHHLSIPLYFFQPLFLLSVCVTVCGVKPDWWWSVNSFNLPPTMWWEHRFNKQTARLTNSCLWYFYSTVCMLMC